jgi:hypothetical protein
VKQHRNEETVTPVWVRPKRGAKMAGIGLTKFYDLMSRGVVENIKVDGIRLAKVASIEALGTASE